MDTPSSEALDALKYSDLQKLAKRLGLRANLKADKLLKALKAHLEHETNKENENKGENQASKFSCDAMEEQIISQEEAKREPADHVAQKRRRWRTVPENTESQDHSEIKISDPIESQKQENQDTQEISTAAEVPSPLEKSQANEDAVFSVRSGINDNGNSTMPSERKKSFYRHSSKCGKSRTTSTTPNFKKLHEAHFKKMESLDQYVKRKKKHFHDYSSSSGLKKNVVATPISLRSSCSITGTPDSRLHSQDHHRATTDQSTSCLKGSVRCSALSTTKMNVRFSAATKDNEHKRSLTKTPSRMSPHVTAFSTTPNRPSVLRTPKSKNIREDSANVNTPFKFTAGTVQTPTSHGKPVFDLQASLSRPLNYKPHKGKMKPWGISKENNSFNQHVNRVSFLKKTYKQPCLQSREEQREKQEQERKEKKAEMLRARRGLIVAKI